MSKLESVTDLLVFGLLLKNGYVDEGFENKIKGVYVSAKKSASEDIKKILSTASKKKTGNAGYPEYIIFDKENNLVIVIENKKDTSKHIYNKSLDEKVDEYAVNGSLWYASKLKEEFEVISIGISGTSLKNLQIDTYLWNKGSETFTNLNIHELLEIDRYRGILRDKEKNSKNLNDLINMNEKAKELNDFLRDYLGVIEHERLYVLGSILFALEDPTFKMGYSRYTNDRSLSGSIWNVVSLKIEGSSLDNKEIVKAELKSTLLGLQDAEKEGVKEIYPMGALRELVKRVDNILYDYHKYGELDIMSIFFNVFLSYSTSGGSDLGIVLTPPHITKMFCDLARLDLRSKILDICTGTGGFLTSAWKTIKLNDKYTFEQKEIFRQNNLYGIEKDKNIYTIVALNLFINKDGRSHIYKGDCFSLDKDIVIEDNDGKKTGIKSFGCNTGFINPPYSDSVYSEIQFVELMLDSLLPESIGIAIIPVNAVSSRTKKHSGINDVKRRILQKNKLLASIQMPSNLFYPKGTETIILVFETGKSNEGETWIAKFDDGYELIKHQGARTPGPNAEKNYTNFMKAYEKKKATTFSFNKKVKFDEQWVYTMYADPDYEITKDDLQETLNDYISYLFKNNYK